MSRILILLIYFSAISLSSNAAESDTYFVSGVSVNITAKSSAAAKTVAHATARRDAFSILITRLDMKLSIVDSITDDEISDMVRSEQIENEKIAGSNYSATFNIMFAKDFVEHVLAQKNSPPVQVKTSEDSYLIIPVKMKKYQPLLWDEESDWKAAISKVIGKKSLTNFVIPDSDIGNIATLNSGSIASLDYATLEPMLMRYKASAAYALIFSYDEIENKVIVDVLRVGKLQKKQVKLSFVNVDRLIYEVLMTKVADKTINYLSSSQKSSNQSVNPDLTRIKIYISKLNNWLLIKNKIESSNLVNRLNLESISRDQIVVTVNYVGSGDIREAFAKQGIYLNLQADNSFTLDAN
jgi:hypothetical protein